jgi:enoyl-CoA hydratase/carnithine racemase
MMTVLEQAQLDPSVALETAGDGILVVRLHTRGSSAKWGLAGGLHAELGPAFAAIAAEPDLRVLVITGTGTDFCREFDMEGEMPGAITPRVWDGILREGHALLRNLLAIPVPVIAAVNGPAHIHAEIALLSDIVLAADRATFADAPHFAHGVVPGDGVQTIWPMLLGPNRGRYFLLTGQEIAAAEAKTLGIVGEILSADALMPRALELARMIASRPPLAARYARRLLTRELSRRIADELELGLALEGLAILDQAAAQP